MRRTVLLLTLVGSLLFVCAGGLLAQDAERSATSKQQPAKDAIPDHYVVVLQDKEDSKKVAKEQAEKHALKVKHVYGHALKGFSAEIPAAKLEKVKSDPRVRYVVEDRQVQEFNHRPGHGGPSDTTPPTVTGVSPTDGATGVESNTSVTATFSEAMKADSLTSSTFTLLKQGTSTAIGATVTYDSTAYKATLKPSAALEANTTYTATVKGGKSGAKDAAGNPLDQDPNASGYQSKSWSFKTGAAADSTPPDTTITSGPSGRLNSGEASFDFASSESGSAFECKLDSGVWESGCSSPKKYTTGLTNGSHTFEVRATDPAGNTDPTPASRTWEVAPTTGVDRIEGDATTNSTIAGDGSGTADVDVAILDGGIQSNHPDLNVVGGTNCSDGTSYEAGNGHAQHVAGTAAAKDDAQGVVGVAPGARLHAVRVLKDDGTGSFSGLICGVDWVTANAATIEVANMSLGGGGSDDGNCGRTNQDPLHEAICNSVAAGVTYVVAAGNTPTGGVNASSTIPASYDEVITVSNLADYNGQPSGGARPPSTCSASDSDDTFRYTSNYGEDVDLGAPGTCIYSTVRDSGYGYMTGTSMASPHVAGAAALHKAHNPSDTPSQVRAALVSLANTEALNEGHTDPSLKHSEPVLLANHH